uniref:Uncharacterized protein n=1 Tax=Sparus aurata TaxID=8175 RepID=A0A671VJZ8_SPAAU
MFPKCLHGQQVCERGSMLPGSQGSLEAVYPECHGNHVREICVYGAGDLPWLLEQHHLFANKFDTDTDPIAVYCLEKYLRQKALPSLVFF